MDCKIFVSFRVNDIVIIFFTFTLFFFITKRSNNCVTMPSVLLIGTGLFVCPSAPLITGERVNVNACNKQSDKVNEL